MTRRFLSQPSGVPRCLAAPGVAKYVGAVMDTLMVRRRHLFASRDPKMPPRLNACHGAVRQELSTCRNYFARLPNRFRRIESSLGTFPACPRGIGNSCTLVLSAGG